MESLDQGLCSRHVLVPTPDWALSSLAARQQILVEVPDTKSELVQGLPHLQSCLGRKNKRIGKRREEGQVPSEGREQLTRAFAEAMYETLRSTETPPGGPATVQSAAVVKTSTMVAMQPPCRVPYRF